MNKPLATICFGLAAHSAQAADPAHILFGTFSNEEQVYFDKESGNPPPLWISMRIDRASDGAMINEIDAFGAAKSDGQPMRVSAQGDRIVFDYGACRRFYTVDGNALVAAGSNGACAAPATMTRIGPEGITLTFADGRTSLLRRARTVSCWSAIARETKKPDGSIDWFFAQNIKIHDQGGRALVGKNASDVKPLVIRMRNVVWPPKPDGSANSNRPSLVLYVHSPDEPDKAISYGWADPGAARIGINLRSMQASCTIDGTE